MSINYNIDIHGPWQGEGKKILLIGPEFFGITQQLCAGLTKLGARADVYDTRPDNTFLTKALIRIHPGLLRHKIRRYYADLLSSISDIAYDYILVIKGEGVSEDVLKALRHQQPQAQLILYNWDEVSQYHRHYKKICPYFDRLLSFDPHDCEEYGMEFVPNFYVPELVPSTCAAADAQYDLMFVGTMRPDRLSIISKINEESKRLGINTYLYLYRQHRLMYVYDRLMCSGIETKDLKIRYTPMPRDKMADVYRQSRIVLDTNRAGQHGLSQRTVEAIGARRKLITTNADIVNYDIYNPTNVLVIDRHNPVIDEDFVHAPYVELPQEMYRQFDIANWISCVFA